MLKKQLEKLGEYFDQTPATDLKYMSYSSEAMLKQSPIVAQLLLWLIAAFILVMLIWASFAQIDEFTRGEGKIVPSSDIQIVQNLEGGILAALLVAEGDIVEGGQPLLQIDDTILSSSFNESALQLEQLTIKAARLRAEANGTVFDTELELLGGEHNFELITSERIFYESRQQQHLDQLDALSQKVFQKRQEVSSVKVNKQILSDSYRLLKKELDVTRPLFEEGAISQVELLRLERQVNDLKGELQRAVLAIPQLQAELNEAKKNMAGYAKGFSNESRGELNDVMAELGRIAQGSDALEDRVDRTIVRSPMKGIVKQIKVKTIGGVIQPGMDLVEIVPFDDSLLVDARVLPADIAFIRPDQLATVKFTAYDFSVHGGLPATVIRISPDTILDEEGVSYYEVRLATKSTHLGKGEEALPIIPGMIVQVDIMTGKKTILDYLLKPILKTKELAFRER